MDSNGVQFHWHLPRQIFMFLLLLNDGQGRGGNEWNDSQGNTKVFLFLPAGHLKSKSVANRVLLKQLPVCVTVPNIEIYPPTLTYIPDNIDVGVVDTGFLEGFQLQRSTHKNADIF